MEEENEPIFTDYQVDYDGSSVELEGQKKKLSPARLSGTAGTFANIVKSFIGAGLILLAKGFANAGLMTAVISTFLAGLLTYHAAKCLIEARRCAEKNFGVDIIDYQTIGLVTCGKHGKVMVEISILLCQTGFTTVYLIFVGQNLSDLIYDLSACKVEVSFYVILWASIPFFILLTFIRHYKYLGPASLVTDCCLVVSVILILAYSIGVLATTGPAKNWSCNEGMLVPVSTVGPNGNTTVTYVREKGGCLYINGPTFPSLFGLMVYTYEGMGTLIPIEMSARDKEQFPKLVNLFLALYAVVIMLMGVLPYLAFGGDIHTIVMFNLPAQGWMRPAIQMMYITVVTVSFPVQTFPCSKILERHLFPNSERRSGKKWQKNLNRTVIVLVWALMATFGASDLNDYVALVGGIAATPLAYVFPAVFHLRCGEELSTKRKIADWTLLLCGTIFATVSSIVAVKTWIDSPPTSATPSYTCPLPGH